MLIGLGLALSQDLLHRLAAHLERLLLTLRRMIKLGETVFVVLLIIVLIVYFGGLLVLPHLLLFNLQLAPLLFQLFHFGFTYGL